MYKISLHKWVWHELYTFLPADVYATQVLLLEQPDHFSSPPDVK